jgi:hypothetical protein
MKLFQYDKKIWDEGDTYHTWKFLIFKNRSFLWVNFESPGRIIHFPGGINILFSLFGSSLFSIDVQQEKFCLAVGIFTEYSEGWSE